MAKKDDSKSTVIEVKDLSQKALISEIKYLQKLMANGTKLSEDQGERFDKLIDQSEKNIEFHKDVRENNKKAEKALREQSSYSRVMAQMAEEKKRDEEKSAARAEKGQSETNMLTQSMAETIGELSVFQKMKDRRDERKIKKEDKETREKITGEKEGIDFSGILKFLKLGFIMDIVDWFKKLGVLLGPVVTAIGGISLAAFGVGVLAVVGFVAAMKGAFDRIMSLDEDATWWDKIGAAIFGALEGILLIPAKIMDWAKGLLSSVIKFFFGEENKVSALLDSFSFADLVKKGTDWILEQWSSLGDWFSGVGESIGKIITAAFDWLKDFFKIDLLTKNMEEGAGLFPSIGKWLGTLIYDAVQWIKDKIPSIAEMTTAIKEFFNPAIQFLTGIGKTIGSTIYDAVQWIKEKIPSIDDITQKITEFLSDPADAVLKVVTMPATLLKDAIAWIVGKLGFDDVAKDLKAIDLVEIMKGVIMAPYNMLKDAVAWVIDAIGIDSMDDFIEDPLGSVLKVITTPYTLLKEAVAWVLGKLGFDDASETLKSINIGDTVKNIIMTPYNLLKKAVNWVMEKLGFGEDGEGGGDISEAEKEESTVGSTIAKIITAPYQLLGKAVDWLMGLFGWDSLKESLPDVSGAISKVSDWLGSTIDGAIKWVKDKFSWIPGMGGDDDEEIDLGIDRPDLGVNERRN